MIKFIHKYAPSVMRWVEKQYTAQKFRQQNFGIPNIGSGDILLMLDSSWDLPIWEEIKAAKENQATILFAVYDLIPIHTHSIATHI